MEGQQIVGHALSATISYNSCKELIALYHHIGGQILISQRKSGWGARVIDQLPKDLKNFIYAD
ncbi:MAG: hypothetical protein MRQ05_00395 [Candidatus Midichloria mitochondrii]|nr:hypothetical protein [Candidatus Midichloria mitochondrii]MDJ1298658.1 hypothetical protein [Candidatus Midichloria mitochondrii]MDJ1312586.1 hypothetical protein [Candidatus Midichloria mitochondrii]